MNSSLSISPSLHKLMSMAVLQDENFQNKKDLITMLHCEQLLSRKCDAVLIMKIHYYVTHSSSPLKSKCLNLLQAHIKQQKFKIRNINMATIQNEIQLNQQFEMQQRSNLLNESGTKNFNNIDSPNKISNTDLFEENDLDIEELEKLKSELEQQVMEQMQGMGSDLKQSSMRFSQILQKDNSTIYDTHTLMNVNESNLTAEQKKLKQVHSDTWRTTCYSLLMFMFVLICFVCTYLVIRLFPETTKQPKLTTFVSTSFAYIWNTIFYSNSNDSVSIEQIVNKEL
eukprot:NODE_772_length_4378_cov_0.184623.p2 type:complete len:283 gc:universal NODE_772_length_4378_cov_0.184623:3521-2673(-)